MLKKLFSSFILGIKKVYSTIKYSGELYTIIDDTLIFKKGFQSVSTRSVHCKQIIKNIIIPEGVLFIEDWFAYGCTSLKEIVIPEGVTHLGNWFAILCNSLKKIKIH